MFVTVSRKIPHAGDLQKQKGEQLGRNGESEK